jgi:DNA topoisomerase-1
MSKKTLVIVESPAKCKAIQGYLGPDYVVLACFGHSVDLAVGGKFGIGVDVLNGFKPKYVLMKDKKDTFNRLVEASENCSAILLAMDQDREGEAIAFHLSSRLQSKTPIKRITFNEITKTAVLAAAANPRDLDMNLVHAQEGRRILDRLVGFCVSPVLMAIYGKSLSAGRVQSVAVRMVVDREAEITSFQPKEYWNLFADVANMGGDSFKVKYDGDIATKDELDIITASLSTGTYSVSSVIAKPKKEKPPAPLTTITLQQVMASKFGFSAERTMKAAQTVYESGLITYMRTDSTHLSDDALKSIRSWIKAKNFSVPTTANIYAAKSGAQEAHEACRPSNVNNDPSTVLLTGDEKSLYEVIWRFTIASQMESAVFDTLEVKVKNGKHTFKASGKALTKKGYLDILGNQKDTKIEIPSLIKGENLQTVGDQPLSSQQNFTKPPARFNESTLIKEMDRRSIGRPSTIATILKNILTRGYVEKKGAIYYPTQLGIEITGILTQFFEFLNFEYSAQLEKRLDKIAGGEDTYDLLMSDFYKIFSIQLRDAIHKFDKLSCVKCHALVSQRENERGAYLACSVCRNFTPVLAIAPIMVNSVSTLSDIVAN